MQQTSVWSVLRKIVCTVFLLATIVFIFSNSAKTGAVSSAFSQQAMDSINAFFARLGLSIRLSHTLIRKLGHFGEFTLLGFWLMLWLRIYTRRVVAFVAWPLLIGLLVAVADEFLQSFIPGRESLVSDVIIDFGGVVCGLLVALLAVLAFNGLQNLFKRRR